MKSDARVDATEEVAQAPQGKTFFTEPASPTSRCHRFSVLFGAESWQIFCKYICILHVVKAKSHKVRSVVLQSVMVDSVRIVVSS